MVANPPRIPSLPTVWLPKFTNHCLRWKGQPSLNLWRAERHPLVQINESIFNLADGYTRREKALRENRSRDVHHQVYFVDPVGPPSFKRAQHGRTTRPPVERIGRKVLLPFGTQLRISRIQPASGEGSRRACQGRPSNFEYSNGALEEVE